MSGRELIEAAAELSRTTWKDRVARLRRLARDRAVAALRRARDIDPPPSAS